MTTDEPLTTARVYHQAWTAQDFDRATALLADNLAVEVPVNDYPTTASFAAALQAFGSMTRGVELLSAMSAGDEAMLLYDMDVEGLGVMRVAEHFTIRNGKIARLRQIHDTAALRAAGFVGATTPPDAELDMATTDNFRADIHYAAAPVAVYDALAAPAGPNGWWTTDGDVVTGSGQDIRLNWSGQDHVIFRVDAADRPTSMRWTCIAQHDRNLPHPDEWVGTTLLFTLSADGQGTRLDFEHRGLTSSLECYGVCRDGWDHFLRRSVRQLVEAGRGLPYQAHA